MLPQIENAQHVKFVPERLLYPVNDAAVLLGISSKKLWSLIYADRIRTVWVDNRRMVPPEAMDEFIAGLPTDRPDLKAEAAV